MPKPNRPSVLMVTGSYPPDVCGVGHYSAMLMDVAPDSWRLFCERDWSLWAMPRILARVMRLKPSDLVVQYPTQGYGWSVVPHLLIFFGWITGRYRTILALHEFTSLSAKSRLCLALVSYFSKHVVFTTSIEQTRARAHRLFSKRVPSSVIGILSNIPWASETRPFTRRAIHVAYFGHVRPNKGIETFLDVMSAVKGTDRSVRIAIIGEVPQGYEEYADLALGRFNDMGGEVILGLEDEAVGDMLGDVRILYLPFPDGVSARRGSVLAGLGNGTLVMSHIGDATPIALAPAIVSVSGSTEDVSTILRTLRYTDVEAMAIQSEGYSYIAKALPRDWLHIVELYGRIISQDRRDQDAQPC